MLTSLVDVTALLALDVLADGVSMPANCIRVAGVETKPARPNCCPGQQRISLRSNDTSKVFRMASAARNSMFGSTLQVSIAMRS